MPGEADDVRRWRRRGPEAVRTSERFTEVREGVFVEPSFDPRCGNVEGEGAAEDEHA